jgi:hypothetical protein
MLPPIEAHILAAAFYNIRKDIKDIDLFNEEFKNTVANCFYWESFIRHHGQAGLNFSFKNVTNRRDIEYQSQYQAVYIINGANAVRELVGTMKNFSKGDRDYWAQLFVDFVKYNIKDALEKSLFRRTIERPFSRPFPEHRGLWLLMSQPEQASNVWRPKA